MSDSGEDILLLADEAAGGELRSRLGPRRCRAVTDPYDALAHMSRRPWPTVLLAGPRTDYRGLCLAARRLQPDGRLYGLCSPAGEPAVRPLAGWPLDDYLIYPPTAEEVRRIVQRSGADPSPRPARAAADPAEAARLIAALGEAAESPAALQEHLAAAVANALGTDLRWTDADDAPPEAPHLLRIETQPPRVLIPAGPARPGRQARALLELLARALPALHRAAERTATLQRLATTDHLTGAYNRRYFYRKTEEVLAEAGREGFRATVLLYDIDDFKRYNDTYGHAAGDEILRDTAALMRRITRSRDIVARIGGDEFAVLFWEGPRPRRPDSNPPDSAMALADRFRRAVRAHLFPSLGPDARGKLSISGGLASFPRDGRTVQQLLRMADRALQEAKASGKNAVLLVGAENGPNGPETEP